MYLRQLPVLTSPVKQSIRVVPRETKCKQSSPTASNRPLVQQRRGGQRSTGEADDSNPREEKSPRETNSCQPKSAVHTVPTLERREPPDPAHSECLRHQLQQHEPFLHLCLPSGRRHRARGRLTDLSAQLAAGCPCQLPAPAADCWLAGFQLPAADQSN